MTVIGASPARSFAGSTKSVRERGSPETIVDEAVITRSRRSSFTCSASRKAWREGGLVVDERSFENNLSREARRVNKHLFVDGCSLSFVPPASEQVLAPFAPATFAPGVFAGCLQCSDSDSDPLPKPSLPPPNPVGRSEVPSAPGPDRSGQRRSCMDVRTTSEGFIFVAIALTPTQGAPGAKLRALNEPGRIETSCSRTG